MRLFLSSCRPLCANFTTLQQPPGLYYYALNKPYNMACQFTSDPNSKKQVTTLKSLNVPRTDCYPANHLETESEGLLLLSNDRRFLNRVAELESEYVAQVDLASHRLLSAKADQAQALAAVEEILSDLVLDRQREQPTSASSSSNSSLSLRFAEVCEQPVEGNLEPPPSWSVGSTYLWPETHVRRRKSTPTQFVRLVVDGGNKDRQVKKLLASAGLPVLRLVRTRVGEFDLFSSLDELGQPGGVVGIRPEAVAANVDWRAYDGENEGEGQYSSPGASGEGDGGGDPNEQQGARKRPPRRQTGGGRNRRDKAIR
jgi:23S rRNA pseudouridine2457 synthase